MQQSPSFESQSNMAVLVALGGATGSVARWQLGEVLGSVVGLAAVNVLGCVAIGLLYGLLDGHPARLAWVKPLLGTGFLGGFTTFSTAILLTSHAMSIQHWLLVSGLVIGLPIGCVAGVGFGGHLARFWAQHGRDSS